MANYKFILKKAIKSWKNLPRNLTQTHRFKKDIERRAIIEADKIADERMKNKKTVNATKIPFFTTWSKDPSLIGNEEKKKIMLRRNIRKEIIKKRLNEARRKKII